jgi:hypothetical protein
MREDEEAGTKDREKSRPVLGYALTDSVRDRLEPLARWSALCALVALILSAVAFLRPEIKGSLEAVVFFGWLGTCITAIVTGRICLRRSRRPSGSRDLAVVALILGWVSVGLVTITSVCLVPRGHGAGAGAGQAPAVRVPSTGAK